MLRVLLITAQSANVGETHDQDEIPAARIVQNVASDLQGLDTGNAAFQSQHSFTELCNVFIADALVVSNENIVLQHYRTLAPGEMMGAAALSLSAAKPAAVL